MTTFWYQPFKLLLWIFSATFSLEIDIASEAEYLDKFPISSASKQIKEKQKESEEKTDQYSI